MNLKKTYQQNKKNKTAIGQFNVYNYEMVKGVVEAGKDKDTSVLIGVSPSAIELIGIEEISSMVDFYKEKFKIPIFINLDHGRDKEMVKKAIDLNYDGVHFDGSKFDFEKNIKIAKEIVSYAKNKNVVVEGEIELIGSEIMTDPKKAKEFVEKTNIDSLAVNIGNMHGVSKSGINPALNIEKLKNISEKIPEIHLVLHGGSGTPVEDLKSAIKEGIVKINFATELKNAYAKSIEEVVKKSKESKILYEVHKKGVKVIKEKVKEKFKLFS